MKLHDLGWNDFFAAHFEKYTAQQYCPVRIIRENRKTYMGYAVSGEVVCEVAGKYRHMCKSRAELPAVGDWAVCSIIPEEKKAVIHALLPRKSFFSRKVVGQITDEQVVAANIDTVFIVTGLDENYNLRRIERYLAMVWNSGATPVIILNKSDMCENPETLKNEVESVAIGVDVLTISAAAKTHIELLHTYLLPGKTVAFLGSSGVGKSTIINVLLGESKQKVRDVSEAENRGRHTTTHREMIVLPHGGIVIDTPGIREIQVWGDEEGLKQAFDDVEELASECRFKDCRHGSEPGCAVKEAISNGNLDAERFKSYLKLKKEYSELSERQATKPSATEKPHWKSTHKNSKNDGY